MFSSPNLEYSGPKLGTSHFEGENRGFEPICVKKLSTDIFDILCGRSLREFLLLFLFDDGSGNS